jgi:hypothetical protein
VKACVVGCFGQSGPDLESESARKAGVRAWDQPASKARLAIGLLCCRLATGVCTSAFVPPAEIGVRSRRSVWSNTAAKSRVLFLRMAPRWLPIGPTHYERDQSPRGSCSDPGLERHDKVRCHLLALTVSELIGSRADYLRTRPADRVVLLYVGVSGQG